MKREVFSKGKTVAHAVAEGLKILEADHYEVDYEVVYKPKARGELYGELYKVRVYLKKFETSVVIMARTFEEGISAGCKYLGMNHNENNRNIIMDILKRPSKPGELYKLRIRKEEKE